MKGRKRGERGDVETTRTGLRRATRWRLTGPRDGDLLEEREEERGEKEGRVWRDAFLGFAVDCRLQILRKKPRE